MKKKLLILLFSLFIAPIAVAGIYFSGQSAPKIQIPYAKTPSEPIQPPHHPFSYQQPVYQYARYCDMKDGNCGESKPKKTGLKQTKPKVYKTYSQPAPVQYKTSYKPEFISIKLKTGSLRDNLIRIIRAHGWSHVIWKVPYDYRWIGNTSVKGSNLENAIAKFIKDYPIQAKFYDANKVVVVVPRNPT